MELCINHGTHRSLRDAYFDEKGLAFCGLQPGEKFGGLALPPPPPHTKMMVGGY
jgi:hypothetical protein